MDDQVKALLARRRDRSIAKVLGYKERECDEFLPVRLRQDLRKVVLDEINDFYDFALDLVNSVDGGGVVLNQMYLDKLDEIYERLTNGD